MKLFVDDQINDPDAPNRHPPEGWVGVATAEEAIALLRSGVVEEIKLDHDLGREMTGYDVALFIEEGACLGTLKPLILHSSHSANPLGKRKINAALLNARKYWMEVV